MPKRPKKIGKVFLLLLSIPIFLLLDSLVYFGKTLPNTYFGAMDFFGKNKDQVNEAVFSKLINFESSSLVFMVGGKEFKAKPAELGINIDLEKTIDSIYLAGSGNLGMDVKKKTDSIYKQTRYSPYYTIDFDKLSEFLDTRLTPYETLPQNATVGFASGKPAILPQTMGNLANRGKLIFDILANVENLSSDPINIKLAETTPDIDSEGATKALARVQSLENAKITLNWKEDMWTLEGDNLTSVLRFLPIGRENGYIDNFSFGKSKVILTNFVVSDAPKQSLNVVIDEDAINSFLDQIAAVVDRQTQDAMLKFENGKVSEFAPAIDGQKLNKQSAREMILSRVSVTNTQTSSPEIVLPVAVTRAKIASEEINSYGIRELIGKGISYYQGSIANRIYNVGLAASRLSATIVAPGDVFSFNKSIGEVSGKTGYKQAYVISDGRTVLDDGGGVCQVSTTVFRAALAAGLPIIARTAHAYRVGYYEEGGFAPGLDATVWAPSVDLEVKNDTEHYILLQTVINNANSSLEVAIYGTSDNRRVDLSQPVISNITPAPEARYQDDPTLPKGVIKQVDFSAPGSNSVFTRKVYKNGTLIYDDVFKSFYKPWQAVYLVGTGS